jgi:hypothetical protein
MEFIFLIAIGLVLGVLLAYGYEKLPFSRSFKKKGLVIGGYRFHHSLYGFILILVTFFLNISPVVAIIMISTGVGIVFQHFLISGTFDIITKERK